MGITHHSNYIRWMEEARVDYLEKIGFGYARLEQDGVISPVLSVNCEYKKSTTFDDVITIDTIVKDFNGIKLCLEYEMKNAKGEIVLIGQSVHGFINEKGRPIRVNKEFPDLYNALVAEIPQ